MKCLVKLTNEEVFEMRRQCPGEAMMRALAIAIPIGLLAWAAFTVVIMRCCGGGR